MKTILTQSEDWKKWFWNLQVNISKKIWLYINFNSDELTLLKLYRCSEFVNFDQNTHSYAQFSAAQQRIYKNAC